MENRPGDTTPEQRIARRRAQREAAAKAKAETSLPNYEKLARALAVDGQMTIEEARLAAKKRLMIRNFVICPLIGAVIGGLSAYVFAYLPYKEEKQQTDLCATRAYLSGINSPRKHSIVPVSPTKATVLFTNKSGDTLKYTYFCDRPNPRLVTFYDFEE